jgi:hypothetical protein
MVRQGMVEQEQGGAANAGELGGALQATACRLADTFRKLHFRGDARRVETPSLIEGVVEALFFEMGRQLASRSASTTAPWSRATGVLRLSPGRGEAALDDEFELLRMLAEGYVERLGASLGVRRRIRAMVESARLCARSELACRVDPTRDPPEVTFGGVVVELYEPLLRH